MQCFLYILPVKGMCLQGKVDREFINYLWAITGIGANRICKGGWRGNWQYIPLAWLEIWGLIEKDKSLATVRLTDWNWRLQRKICQITFKSWMDKALPTLRPTKQWIAFHRQHFIIWECTSWKTYRYFPILFHCCKDIMIRRPRRIITCAKENSCLEPKQAPQRQALSLTLDLKSARTLPLPVENEREPIPLPFVFFRYAFASSALPIGSHVVWRLQANT